MLVKGTYTQILLDDALSLSYTVKAEVMSLLVLNDYCYPRRPSPLDARLRLRGFLPKKINGTETA